MWLGKVTSPKIFNLKLKKKKKKINLWHYFEKSTLGNHVFGRFNHIHLQTTQIQKHARNLKKNEPDSQRVHLNNVNKTTCIAVAVAEDVMFSLVSFLFSFRGMLLVFASVVSFFFFWILVTYLFHFLTSHSLWLLYLLLKLVIIDRSMKQKSKKNKIDRWITFDTKNQRKKNMIQPHINNNFSNFSHLSWTKTDNRLKYQN